MSTEAFTSSLIWKDRWIVIASIVVIAGCFLFHDHHSFLVELGQQQQLKSTIAQQQDSLKQQEASDAAVTAAADQKVAAAQSQISTLQASIGNLQIQIAQLTVAQQQAISKVQTAPITDVATQTQSAIGQPVQVENTGEFLSSDAARAALSKLLQEQFQEKTIADQTQELSQKDGLVSSETQIATQRESELDACQLVTTQQKTLIASQASDIAVQQKLVSSEKKRGWLHTALGFIAGAALKALL